MNNIFLHFSNNALPEGRRPPGQVLVSSHHSVKDEFQPARNQSFVFGMFVMIMHIGCTKVPFLGLFLACDEVLGKICKNTCVNERLRAV